MVNYGKQSLSRSSLTSVVFATDGMFWLSNKWQAQKSKQKQKQSKFIKQSQSKVEDALVDYMSRKLITINQHDIWANVDVPTQINLQDSLSIDASNTYHTENAEQVIEWQWDTNRSILL